MHAHLLLGHGVAHVGVSAELHETSFSIDGVTIGITLDVVFNVVGVSRHGPVIISSITVARRSLAEIILAAECRCGTGISLVALLVGKGTVMEQHGISDICSTVDRHIDNGIDVGTVGIFGTVFARGARPCLSRPDQITEVDVYHLGKGGGIAPLGHYRLWVETAFYLGLNGQDCSRKP